MSQPKPAFTHLNDLIVSTDCFTAADAVKACNPNNTIEPRLHDIVFAVIVLKNGQIFSASTVYNQDGDRDYKLACQKATKKAMRKLHQYHTNHS